MGGLLLSESLACRTRFVSVMVAYIAVSYSIDRRLLFGAGPGYAPSYYVRTLPSNTARDSWTYYVVTKKQNSLFVPAATWKESLSVKQNQT